jgi:hypothetical protein
MKLSEIGIENPIEKPLLRAKKLFDLMKPRMEKNARIRKVVFRCILTIFAAAILSTVIASFSPVAALVLGIIAGCIGIGRVVYLHYNKFEVIDEDDISKLPTPPRWLDLAELRQRIQKHLFIAF